MRKTKRIVKAAFGSDGRLRATGPKGEREQPIPARFDAKRASTPAAFKSDRDVPKLTKRELSQMRLAEVDNDIDVGAIRRKLNICQSVFAAQFGITLAVLRDWEQGRRKPDATARAYLKVVGREPDTVRRILRTS